MNEYRRIDTQKVKQFQIILHGLFYGCQEAGELFDPLEAAIAAEYFAADLRKKSADDFKKKMSADNLPGLSEEGDSGPKTFPEWIGG